MSVFAVTAIGADRPGIVAAVSGVLVERGCNLEDTSMSILRGHFAMVLIVAAPDDLAPEVLEADVLVATRELGLVVAVRPVSVEAGHGGAEVEAWTVVIYGADHPGIVHGVTRLLAGLGVSVVDLTTKVTDGPPPLYAMVMEVAVPPAVDPRELERRLAAEAAELGVECTLHPSEADIL